ncbi:MAG: OsmC family peroxiredoxin [Thermoleophilaceae bacterium]
MADVTRNASVHWEGDIRSGSGKLDLASSGAAGDLPISLPTRSSDDASGQTSPEELIAASHAGCYAMALSMVLTQGGNPPESLDASAEVALAEASGGGYEVTRSELTVRGRVPGLDAEGFEMAAKEAEQACPISNAMRGNVEISVNAELEGG